MGFFVEIGARDGIISSNTLFFERELGWTGLLIEPNPTEFERIAANRPNCIRLQAAVCNETQTLHFVLTNDVGGIYEFMSKSFLAQWHPNINVKQLPPILCLPFWKIFASPVLVHVRHIDLFSLDVEGAELTALYTFPFDRISVSVWLIEQDQHNVTKNRLVRTLLGMYGYQSVGRLQLTEVFVGPSFNQTSVFDTPYF